MSVEEVVIVGKKPTADYVLSAVILFNQGVERVVVKGRGEDISKTVDVVNSILQRLGDAVKVKGVRIGSDKIRGRLVSYIEVVLEKTI